MSETLRELTVRLSMDSGNVNQDLKGLATAVKQADANFRQAGAGIKNFEQTTEGARAKVTQLNERLNAQQAVVTKQAQALNTSRQRLQEVSSRHQEYAGKVEAARAALEKEVAASGKNSEASKKLAEDLKKLEGQHERLGKQAENAARGVQRNELALTEAQTAVKGTEAALKQANAELARSESRWARFGDSAKKAQEKLKSGGQKMSSAGQAMTRSLTLPIMAAGSAVMAANIQWESAFAGVRKTVDGSEEQLKKVHDGILNMSQEIPASASAIAQVAENAGQLGIATDNVLGFSRVMIDLGNTTNLSADEGAIALAQFANITQMSQGNFDRLGSTIVALGNNYATTERDIVNMGTRLAAAGKQIGLSEASIMAVATAAASVGIEAEAGGTALSTVMLNIDMASAKGGKAIQGYARVAGMSAKEFTAAWKQDPAKALTSFVKGLEGIQQSGGNVALTLEQMGYKEKRVRDALMRLAGAGDLLSGALGTADSAWQENIALTNEASTRYGTAASRLQVLRNRAVATGISFGNAMTPFLEKAMDAVSGLLDRFQALSPAQQENIVKWGLMAAAIGPVINATGKLMTSTSMILKAFSGPAGWIGLAVAGAAALGIALANTKSAAQLAQEKLRGLTITVSPESKQAIQDAINEGINAANKEHQITVAVDADTAEIDKQLEAIFSDGKMTNKEYKAASKYINDKVLPDIEKAKQDLEKKVAEYKKSLEGATDVEGQPLTEAEKETLVQEFQSKNAQQIADLEAALAEYQGLLTTIKNQGGKATEEQIANLEAALAKVGELRKAIQGAQDDALKAAKADYNLTVTGGGNERSMGKALGYVAQTRANELAAANAALQAELANAEENSEAAARAHANFERAVSAIDDKAQKGYQEIAAGVAKANPEMAKAVEQVNAYGEGLSNLMQLDAMQGIRKGSFEEIRNNIATAIAGIPDLDSLIPEGKKATLEGMLSKDASDLTISDIDWMEGAVRQLAETLTGKIAETMQDPALEPMGGLLSGLLDAKAFEAITPDTVSGPLLAMLKLVDLKSGGEALGKDVPEGIKLGINAGAPSSLNASQLAPMKTALEGAVRSLFQIQSPSRIMIPFGREIPAGLAKGIISNKNAVIKALQEVYGAAIAEAKRLDKLLKEAMETLYKPGPQGGTPGGTTSTRGVTAGNTVTNSGNATVNVANMIVRGDTDAAVIANQVAALNRRSMMALGARVFSA